MTFITRSAHIKQWFKDQDPFTKVDTVKGKVVRSKEGRTTQRFEIDGHGYYVKHHKGIGWKEIIKNLVQGRLPIVGAANEWHAINLLKSLNIDTLDAVAYGKKGLNPAQQESFLITKELANTSSLAVVAEQWPKQPPTPAFKRALIAKVAGISRTMHQAGMNHRDLYICHFLLEADVSDCEQIKLFVVDLHRAQIRKQVPRRWLVKDVGSLLFSAMDIGLTSRDIMRFLKHYFNQPLAELLVEHRAFLSDCEQRAIALYKRDFKRAPVLPYKNDYNK
jgi:heptose I phosphotransferase